MRRRYNRTHSNYGGNCDSTDTGLPGYSSFRQLSLSTLERNYEGVFFTDSWLDFTRNSPLDLDKLEAERGKEGAAKFIKKLYGRINQFYIIDTGCYDLTPVRKYVRRMAHILNGTVEEIQGQYGILKKIAKNQFDEDFLILRKGDTVPHGFTFPVSTK